jgi:ABC-type branched-subunit amino acid transport system substrate-binding protein
VLTVVLGAAGCSSTNQRGRSVDVGAQRDLPGTETTFLDASPTAPGAVAEEGAPPADDAAGPSEPAPSGTNTAGTPAGSSPGDSAGVQPGLARGPGKNPSPASRQGAAGVSPSPAPTDPNRAAGEAGTPPVAGQGVAPTPAGPIGPPSGKGFTASTISIGVELLDETSNQGARLIGASNTDTGPTRKYATAVVDHLNASGGIAGRKITPVFHTTNVLSGTWDSHAQAACSAFAEDNKVFAAVAAMYQLSEVLARCLAQHTTPIVLNGRAVRDDQMLGELADFLYMPSRMSATRFAGLTVDGLADLGFFTPGAKVGILRFDRPVQARVVNGVMRPRLAQRGVKVVAEEAVSYPDSINGFGTTSAQLSSAVLRLRAAGVTHLVPLDDHGILAFLFMPQAESQGFRPRYGLSTNNQPFVIEDNVPPEQFKGAVGVGWVPADDVAFERNPGGNPSEDLCRGIFQRAGAEFPSRFAWSNALNYCDSLLFLKAALDRAPNLSVGGLRAAVANLADGGFASAYTFRTAFTRDRHDGAAAYRSFRFHDDCRCVRYEGPVRAL